VSRLDGLVDELGLAARDLEQRQPDARRWARLALRLLVLAGARFRVRVVRGGGHRAALHTHDRIAQPDRGELDLGCRRPTLLAPPQLTVGAQPDRVRHDLERGPGEPRALHLRLESVDADPARHVDARGPALRHVGDQHVDLERARAASRLELRPPLAGCRGHQCAQRDSGPGERALEQDRLQPDLAREVERSLLQPEVELDRKARANVGGDVSELQAEAGVELVLAHHQDEVRALD
jgi:hypothetical protein